MREQIISGTIWTSFNLIVTKGLQFIVKLILARLLLPEHFGIVGMAVVFTSIISVLGEMGIAAYLIRSRDDEINETHYQTAFWASIVFNSLIYLLLAAAVAPFAAWFYEEQILRLVLPVLGVSALISPFNLIPRVILTRNLRFKRLNLIQIIPAIISGIISISLAISGYGVWSIVVHGVIAGALTTPVYWFSVQWRPKKVFSKKALIQILGYGVYDTSQNTLVTLTKNIDYLIIGKMIGATSLGFYTLAFTLTDTFRQQIMGIMNKVMFPVYGRVQTDILRIKRYYLTVIKFNTALTSGAMLILVLFTTPIISLIFGERWMPAVIPIKMMAIASVIHTMGGTSVSVLKALGYFNIQFRMTLLITSLVIIPGFIIGTILWGINGAAFTVIIGKIVERIYAQYYMRKFIGVTELDILSSIKPSLIGIIAVLPFYFSINSLMQQQTYIGLMLSVVIVLLVYGLTLYFIMKDELRKTFRKRH